MTALAGIRELCGCPPRTDGTRALIVAEIAQAHDGSLGLAHAYVDAAAAAGADAVKFQTHIAGAEGTAAEPWRVRFSVQDVTRADYWRRTAFSEEQWRGLRRHAEERGLAFLSSPFSVEAAHLLRRVGVAAWKVPSGEVSTPDLLDLLAADGLPVLLSSGMSPMAELDAAVARVRAGGAPLAVLQATSRYPCPPERVGLNLLAAYRERYACPVGISDHSGTIYPALAAVALGAEVVEVHLTMSRDLFGPDVAASVTTAELRALVDGVRFIERALAHPVDKDAVAAELAPVRAVFTKSVVACVPLRAGTVLRAEHLGVKKPGVGLPAAALPRLVGARLLRDVAADEALAAGDVDVEPAGAP
jgi:N,N'-diacetyllegionaminate synthase